MISIKNNAFGKTTSGERVSCWTLTNERGMSAEVLTYGGILRALHVPVGGATRDVVLGFDDVAGYEGSSAYLGAVVGRVANRIGGAQFTLDGKTYPLAANNGPNCLHGGIHGFHEKLWSAEMEGDSLVLSCASPDGEEGFPGTLRVHVTYTLGEEDDSLTIDYMAECDASTPVNLTNHSYFNLKGAGDPTVEDHRVWIFADQITEADARTLPTGALLDVGGTPFDLREGQLLGPGLHSEHAQILYAKGYDHNYVLKHAHDGVLRPAAKVECAGLRLECLTTEPGLQLYTSNYLSIPAGKGGIPYGRQSALCLETQNWPDAVNQAGFPSPILRPGQVYRHTTVYRFREI